MNYKYVTKYVHGVSLGSDYFNLFLEPVFPKNSVLEH